MQGTKRRYTTPQLAVHGTFAEVTKQDNKTFGASDGFLLLDTNGEIVPIKDIS
jgi:hypothetical protein